MYTFLKRLLDIICAFTALVLFLLPMVVVGICIYIRLDENVVFKQRRVGLNEKVFTIYKFKTMNNLKDSSGALLPDEQRLTKLGKFIRKTSLDELPQLINVIKGEMSLVGPRPLLPEYLSLYSEEQKKRHNVKPGITGWAQVNGRNELPWERKFQLDIDYINKRSFSFDLKILLKTTLYVLKRKGINQTANCTMKKFTGDY
ncbi:MULTISPECIES: sugar transferase [unclassified Enterococcus]|uniref:sugar transferase n=1 Tax=unclassified Enterococcus TaxID=2608891 RepID=UPI00298C5556|nr:MULTISPECIES: sugar transferase [unclassified Enterococcus]